LPLYISTYLCSNYSSVLQEVSNELLSHLSLLLASPLLPEVASAQQKSYVTYTLPEDPKSLRQQGEPLPAQDELTLTLLESRSVISASATTGLRTWEAALHLGTYLSLSDEGRDFIRGKRVLELGSGTGFLSILCAKHLGSMQVLATDGDPNVVEMLETNFFLNGLDGDREHVEASVLKWGWALMGGVLETRGEIRTWDVALGADVVSLGY
jgi:protein-lysine N-methyltransferase EEF2KMT